MLVTIVGLVVVLLAAFFVAWPLLSDAEAEDRSGTKAPAGSTPEHDKEQALIAIREADFDHRTGKLSDEDYRVLREELEERAFRAMAEIDDAAALHAVTPGVSSATATAAPPRASAEPAGFCPACGVRFSRGARFCPGCGKRLPGASQRGRRRA